MYDELTLPNGLRIVGERIPHFRSVSVGLWIGAGSQYESAENGGVSHFIEHMLFKGTARRNARQIAEEIDAVGGQMNAFTAKECTCFYAKVVDEHFELALDVISDIVLHSLLDPADIEKEKGVVIEEIAMAEDSPEDVVSELIMLAQYGDQPLARPILGQAQTVSGFTRDDIVSYMDRMYRPENAVLAVAGNYDLDQLHRLAEKMLGEWQGGLFQSAPYVTQPGKPSVLTKEKDIEQVHLCIGYPGPAMGSEEIYPLSLLNSVFGGAASSRLFQTIREERSLAYSVYSYPSSFTDAGQLVIYAGINAEHLDEVVSLIGEETNRLLSEGLGRQEFEQGREQLKGGYILALESTASRMNSLGRRKLLLGSTQSETDVIDKVNAITYDQVMDVARRVFTAQRSVALVGKGVGKMRV